MWTGAVVAWGFVGAWLGCAVEAVVGDTDETAQDTDIAACNAEVAAEVAAGAPELAGVVVSRDGAWRGNSGAFLGIPYAKPPVGDLRLRPPVPRGCVEGVTEVTGFGPMCPQRVDGSIVGNEDCLHLNIWAPASSPTGAGLPVLFFVHGGGNVQGSTQYALLDVPAYDGSALAAKYGAVVVTANYRLGAMGFLAHPELSTEGSGGNLGLRDQLAALDWVAWNIAAFGGDPSRVLLFGQSAGALDACALLASPEAAGRFSSVLLESGACAARPRSEAEEFGARAAASLGCTADVPACLRALPAETLAGIAEDPISDLGVPGQSGFGPMVDVGIGELPPVIPVSPLEALRNGAQGDRPLVVGSNADESALWVEELSEGAYTVRVRDVFGGDADAVLAVYPSSGFATPREAWVALTTDVAFTCPARRIARTATGPVWRYFFTHRLAGRAGDNGARHGLELLFVFDRVDDLGAVTGYRPTAEDDLVTATIGDGWTRLARDGAPGPAWPGYGPRDPYLELGDAIRAGEGVRTEACDLWDRLGR
jgi:para-nitrobenzyl esterase